MQTTFPILQIQPLKPTLPETLNPVQKKKQSILKKKKLPATKLFSNINIKHVVNIGDICFVNENSLRNPEQSEETLLKSLFHYKMISKVTLNSFFVNIQLKKCEENLLPPEYFFERLRSFGDKRMAKIADHLEKIHSQFSFIKEKCASQENQENLFSQNDQQVLLRNFLHTMEGKKCFVYFSEITPARINMKNIIFSTPLLQALGCDIKNIAIDFLKYKHVFFQVFSTKNYAYFMEKCLDTFAELQKKLIENPSLMKQYLSSITSFQYEDELILKKEDENGIYEELTRAKVRWSAPHTSICCIEILQINESSATKLPNKRRMLNFIQTKPEQQLESLKKIGIVSPLYAIENGIQK